jgi:hypothetical protein
LIEIAQLADARYNDRFVALYLGFMTHLLAIIRPGTNICSMYDKGEDAEQEFIQRLGLFFTTFFKVRRALLWEALRPTHRNLTGCLYADTTSVLVVVMVVAVFFLFLCTLCCTVGPWAVLPGALRCAGGGGVQGRAAVRGPAVGPGHPGGHHRHLRLRDLEDVP